MKTQLKTTLAFSVGIAALFIMEACQNASSFKTEKQNDTLLITTAKKQMETNFKSGHASVNGLNMYYEIHGSGRPLVLIHGGGSTIQTTFGNILPYFAAHRQVIAMDLQAHGRTADIDRPTTFEQDADDVAALLRYLKIDKADVMGFSNGGSTGMQLAIRHPELVRKAIFVSSFYQREGMQPQFWEFMNKGTFADMPSVYKEEFLKVAPRPEQLINMYEKDSGRMLGFKGWPDEMIRSITVPAMVMISNADVVMPEHAVKMARLMPKGQVVIVPGLHGQCIGEIAFWKKEDSTQLKGVAAMLEQFLDAPADPAARAW